HHDVVHRVLVRFPLGEDAVPRGLQLGELANERRVTAFPCPGRQTPGGPANGRGLGEPVEGLGQRRVLHGRAVSFTEAAESTGCRPSRPSPKVGRPVAPLSGCRQVPRPWEPRAARSPSKRPIPARQPGADRKEQAMVRRWLSIVVLAMALLVVGGGSALACGGLVAPGHAEVLRKATTLSAWHAGYEHYVTGFRFAGDAKGFGYIIPLPGGPVKIEKGGDWTLERLESEIHPVKATFAGPLAAADRGVIVLQKVRVDALDITVVRGGGPDVAAWAQRNGFDLTPDAGRVLGQYSDGGAVFALAKFDALESSRRGLIEGQGTTI